MIPRPSSRRTAIDRWIIGLAPLLDVVTSRISALKLGEPSVCFGPSFMGQHDAGDRIRKGAVWFISGKNCGFHVDFLRHGIIIDAWTGSDRQVSVSVVGKVSEATLKKDLSLCLATAGLTDLARTEQVRSQLFPTAKARQ